MGIAQNFLVRKISKSYINNLRLNLKFFKTRNPFQQLEEERREAEARLDKMKNEMEGVFDLKVKEKIARLKESEQNVGIKVEKI